jgi:hypothetical protein
VGSFHLSSLQHIIWYYQTFPLLSHSVTSVCFVSVKVASQMSTYVPVVYEMNVSFSQVSMNVETTHPDCQLRIVYNICSSIIVHNGVSYIPCLHITHNSRGNVLLEWHPLFNKTKLLSVQIYWKGVVLVWKFLWTYPLLSNFVDTVTCSFSG